MQRADILDIFFKCNIAMSQGLQIYVGQVYPHNNEWSCIGCQQFVIAGSNNHG
jgi:hypothetical protein